MDPHIATLRRVIQSFVDSGFLSIFRYMDGHGGGKEEITFLKKGGYPIAVLRTPYLPDIAELHNTRPLEGDMVLTNVVLEFVPALPDDETNFREFIGMRNIIIPDICIHRGDLFMRDLFPCGLARSVSSRPLEVYARPAYQMTPEYLAEEAECKAQAMQEPPITQTTQLE